MFYSWEVNRGMAQVMAAYRNKFRKQRLEAEPAPTFGSHCSRFHPNRFTFSRVIDECVKTVDAP